MKPEELTPRHDAGRVDGLLSWYGTDTVRVLYRTDDGVDERLLSRADEESCRPSPQERTRKLDATGHASLIQLVKGRSLQPIRTRS